jgi:hypothetical protein
MPLVRGIQLTLLIGPAVPVPAPRAVVDALTRVSIQTAAGETQSGFELDFSIDKRSPLHTAFVVTSGSGIPLLRVVLIGTLGGMTEVLIDGVVTQHQVESGKDGAPATLRVQGKDLSAVMNVLDLSGIPYPAMPPSLRVLTILARYAWLGIVPLVVPGIIEDVPLPIQEIPRHQGTDFAYLTKLAAEAGYVFYMEPSPVPGSSIAYWGPEIRVGPPQSALSVDMDAHTNVESLSFRFDREKKELPVVYIQESVSKAPIPIPIPDITPLNPPLGLVPPIPQKVVHLTCTAKYSPLRAALTGLAYASQHADAVFGSGSLDVLRYGRILRSRRLVGVRGAGAAYDGLYFVKSVTHEMKRGEYKQNFELARNGVLSTVPKVPVGTHE